jgi:hypothetical protein
MLRAERVDRVVAPVCVEAQSKSTVLASGGGYELDGSAISIVGVAEPRRTP